MSFETYENDNKNDNSFFDNSDPDFLNDVKRNIFVNFV